MSRNAVSKMTGGRCLTRRAFVALAGLGAVAALAPLTPAYAADESVYLGIPDAPGGSLLVQYGGTGTAIKRIGYSQSDRTWLGYCAYPQQTTPYGGHFYDSYNDVMRRAVNPEAHRELVRKILYYGCEGPGQASANIFPATRWDGAAMDWSGQYVIGHILLAYVYNGMDANAREIAYYGTDGGFRAWADVWCLGSGADSVLSKVQALPNAPASFWTGCIDTHQWNNAGELCQPVLYFRPMPLTTPADVTKTPSNPTWISG